MEAVYRSRYETRFSLLRIFRLRSSRLMPRSLVDGYEPSAFVFRVKTAWQTKLYGVAIKL
jgi:hypothetical protein